MEERFLKGFWLLLVIILVTTVGAITYLQHEKYELLKEAIRSGNYVLENTNCK